MYAISWKILNDFKLETISLFLVIGPNMVLFIPTILSLYLNWSELEAIKKLLQVLTSKKFKICIQKLPHFAFKLVKKYVPLRN